AFEPGQNEVAMRADHVFEHAEDVRLELLDVGAVEHGPADADHSGTNLVDAHLRRRRREMARQKPGRAAERGGEHRGKPPVQHGLSHYTLTVREAVWYRHAFDGPQVV